jgi:dihydroxyacetone kinase
VTGSLRAAVLAAADAIDAARAHLGVLDGAAGDGDHGMTMSIGARNVRRRLADLPPEATPAELMHAVASAMGGVGGAIGPLYSAALTAAATEIGGGTAEGAAELGGLRRAGEAAEAAIASMGHAAPGDKTILDALHPLVESLRASEAGTTDLGTALGSAAGAAEAGAAGTAAMVARIGRASRLGERSRGMPDAGATSFAIIVRAMVEAAGRPPAGGGSST